MELTVQRNETDTEQAMDKLITNSDQCNEENESGLWSGSAKARAQKSVFPDWVGVRLSWQWQLS